jgi:hypothetical protein
MLKFSKGNSKIKVLANWLGLSKSQVVSFDLPAGFSCPKADICKGFANKLTGKLTRVGKIPCYAVKQENYLPSVRKFRWGNFTQLLAVKNDFHEMVKLINNSISDKILIVRVHSSGDYFCDNYFHAWLNVAMINPYVKFFGYTKVLKYATSKLPDNFKLVYSYGSKDDEEYDTLEVKPPTCFINDGTVSYNVPTVCETHGKGFEDFFMIMEGKSFQINLH